MPLAPHDPFSQLKPLKGNDRVVKVGKKGKTTTKAFDKHSLLLNADPQFRIHTNSELSQQTQSSSEEIEFLTEALASTRLESRKPRVPHPKAVPLKRQRANSAPSIVHPVAAEDSLIERVSQIRIDGQPPGPSINVHFYRLNQPHPIVNPLIIHTSEVENLVDFTDIILRRRRWAFREFEFTKKSPCNWHFSVISKYVQEVPVRYDGEVEKAVITKRYNEMCGGSTLDTDYGHNNGVSPYEGFDRMLKACKELKDRRELPGEHAGNMDMGGCERYTVVDVDSSGDHLSEYDNGHLHAVVDVYFT